MRRCEGLSSGQFQVQTAAGFGSIVLSKLCIVLGRWNTSLKCAKCVSNVLLARIPTVYKPAMQSETNPATSSCAVALLRLLCHRGCLRLSEPVSLLSSLEDAVYMPHRRRGERCKRAPHKTLRGADLITDPVRLHRHPRNLTNGPNRAPYPRSCPAQVETLFKFTCSSCVRVCSPINQCPSA